MGTPDNYQRRFGDRPLMMGSVLALRRLFFSWDEQTGIRISGDWGGEWVDGENVATCRATLDGHLAGTLCDETDLMKCSCGFYGAWSLQHLYQPAIAAVVEHYGETLIGERGVRSRKARLKSMYLVDAGIRTYSVPIAKKFPSVEVVATPSISLEEWAAQTMLREDARG